MLMEYASVVWCDGLMVIPSVIATAPGLYQAITLLVELLDLVQVDIV